MSDLEDEAGDSRRTFVIGAGASHSHSRQHFPVLSTFLSAAARLGIDFGNPSYQGSFKGLLRFASDYGVAIPNENDETNLEELFTHLEIDIEREPTADLLKAREQLLRLVNDVLAAAGSAERENRRPPTEYWELAARVREDDTIITFNWDTLLDDELGREQVLAAYYGQSKNRAALEAPYGQFARRLSGLREGTFEGLSPARPVGKPPVDGCMYLKLHGSVDWLACANDGCRVVGRVYPVLRYERPPYCAECFEVLDRVLVPPVLNKALRRIPLIRRIWNNAAARLQTTRELVIWGYSMPPTDFYASWLLRRIPKHLLRRLAIIDPRVDNADFRDRFLRPFLPDVERSCEVSTFRSFGEWLAKQPSGRLDVKWR